MKYPPTRYKEHIVEIRIIPTDEHSVERVKEVIYGAGKARKTDVIIEMFERHFQFISSHELFRKDPPSIVIPPRVVDAKIPTFKIQTKNMDIKIHHLLQLMVSFDVRDEDVQSVGVFTGMIDAGTQRETHIRQFHVQLTAKRAIPPVRFAKWPSDWFLPQIMFTRLISANHWFDTVKRWVDNHYLYDRGEMRDLSHLNRTTQFPTKGPIRPTNPTPAPGAGRSGPDPPPPDIWARIDERLRLLETREDSPSVGGAIASFAPGFTPGPARPSPMEDRIRALEKGITEASLSASVDGVHYQRAEESIIGKVRDLMTNQIIPQAILFFFFLTNRH
jgi:hypothetical protein